MLAASLARRAGTAPRTVTCNKQPLGFFCTVTTRTRPLVCEADGSGLEEHGAASLSGAWCDTRSHYSAVFASTAKLVNSAIAVANANPVLQGWLSQTISQGNQTACLIGRDTKNDGRYGTVILSIVPSKPTTGYAGTMIGWTITPTGDVASRRIEREHVAAYAACDITGTRIRVSRRPKPNLLVSQAKAMSTAISFPAAPPPTPTPSHSPSTRAALKPSAVETALHKAIRTEFGGTTDAVESSCDDIGPIAGVNATTVFACSYIDNTGTDQGGCFGSPTGTVNDLADVTTEVRSANPTVRCVSYFAVGPGSTRCGNVSGGNDLVTSSGDCSKAATYVSQAVAACGTSDSCNLSPSGFCSKTTVAPLDFTRYACTAPGTSFYFRIGGRPSASTAASSGRVKPLATASPAALGSGSSFRSPSGNILCGYVEGSGYISGVECYVVSNRTLAILPNEGRAETKHNVVIPPYLTFTVDPGVVPYGKTWRPRESASVSCTSALQGITCINQGHSQFFVSKQRVSTSAP
jgi:hypothetical protein